MTSHSIVRLALLPLLIAACGSDNDDQTVVAGAASERAYADAYGRDTRISAEDLERGRMDAGWRRFVELDTTTIPGGGNNPEQWETIAPEAVNTQPTHLPLYGDIGGPSVLRVQILLDRSLFSPGVMDGRWGKNTEKAVYWMQRREGLRGTGAVDEQTFERLRELAGNPTELVRRHRLTAEDVEGPFVQIPEDIYDKADMECMCYESLSEKLSEQFHATPEILAKLNPDADLNGLEAGQEIFVPNVRDANAAQNTQVAKLVVSDGGHYVHAVDAQNRVLFHFPSTLGSDYSPSPDDGDYRVTGIAPDPTWNYQPDLIEGAEPGPDAIIPPGPNNAVGVVWMALSKPHYGIHGTSAPATIGYATSSGCVRLTNWDASFLSERIEEGIAVEFRDAV